jgi:hypothetical protein
VTCGANIESHHHHIDAAVRFYIVVASPAPTALYRIHVKHATGVYSDHPLFGLCSRLTSISSPNTSSSHNLRFTSPSLIHSPSPTKAADSQVLHLPLVAVEPPVGRSPVAIKTTRLLFLLGPCQLCPAVPCHCTWRTPPMPKSSLGAGTMLSTRAQRRGRTSGSTDGATCQQN